MRKRKGFVLKNLASLQIFLIVLAVVSINFFMSNLVSAQISLTPASGSTASSGSGIIDVPFDSGSGIIKAGESFKWAQNQKGFEFTQGSTKFNIPATDVEKAIETGTLKINSVGVEPYEGMWGVTGGWGHLLVGAMWGLGAYSAVQMLGGLLKLDQPLTDALSYGAGAGVFGANAIQSLGPGGFLDNPLFGNGNFFMEYPGWVGLGIAVIVFVLTYKEERLQKRTFECLPWEAPVGGKKCEQCNGDKFRPCSEYRCRALGQACELVNAGTTDEKCTWINPNDALSPTITTWATPLTEGHKYAPHTTRPSALGTKIVRESATNGCLKAFTPLTFGISTNEPAQCKIDLDHKNSSEAMQFYVGNSNLFKYNHTQTFSLPSPSSLNSEYPQLQNDGRYDFFIRCKDKNGNENVDEFAVQFCVDPSPDTTPPMIVSTSINSGSAVRFGVGSVPLQVYVNEPATCKWSTQEKSYESMENTMTCASSITQINARELYACSTTLNGIVDRQENKFYFRCKDQPNKLESERFVMATSYEFILKGSQHLNIISVAPNGTIKGNTPTIAVDLKVTTDDGSDEGKAICSFSPTGAIGSFDLMFETEKFEHTQRLNLPTGNYGYQFRCVDLGGNAAQSNVSFSVFVDNLPPLITRAYHDSANTALKIVTNEDADCVYSLLSCNYNFDDGLELTQTNSANRRNHYVAWKPNSAYYLKCKDDFGNEPAPNACSMVASATNIA